MNFTDNEIRGSLYVCENKYSKNIKRKKGLKKKAYAEIIYKISLRCSLK